MKENWMKFVTGLLLVATCLWCQVSLAQPPGTQGQSPASRITGDWSGTLEIGSGLQLRFVFHFTQQPDGSLSGTIDSPDQNAMGIPFSKVTQTGLALHTESDAIHATFDGSLATSGSIINGTWGQGGLRFPLTLTAGSKPINRPQTPKPPFPYVSKDISFPGPAGVTLAGTLTLPWGNGPFCCVVLISGTGPLDRNQSMMGHQPFWVLADYLARRGIAVLRYDKRGIGKSIGMFRDATTADFATDAQAAVKYLQTVSAIDPQRIGLLGHSEGGLIASIIAAKDSKISFIVFLAGPGLRGDQIILRQSTLIGQAQGISPEDLAKLLDTNTQIIGVLTSENDLAVARPKVEQLLQDGLKSISPKLIAKLGGSTQAIVQTRTASFCTPWMQFFLRSDPGRSLCSVHCPVLALNGSKDLQIPADENLSAITADLKVAGNNDVTIKKLEGLNHLFQTCQTGSPSEYGQIEQTISPEALGMIGDWILAHEKTSNGN
jgi:pimeloyl-ACP methyl ester carboxylesterase